MSALVVGVKVRVYCTKPIFLVGGNAELLGSRGPPTHGDINDRFVAIVKRGVEVNPVRLSRGETADGLGNRAGHIKNNELRAEEGRRAPVVAVASDSDDRALGGPVVTGTAV